MSKLIIMKGLPASGKSTKAEELTKQGNTVRINKDLLRTMLHFDKFNHNNEHATQVASLWLASGFLIDGKNVIIDDTNLNPKTVQSYIELAKSMDAKIEYMDFTDVDVDTCIERDNLREKKVGKHVIQRMAFQHLDYWKGEKVVICDMDGTLADCEHRQHFLNGEKKDWRGFFSEMGKDTLRVDVYEQVKDAVLADEDVKLILVSARPDNYREATENWLFHNMKFKYDALIMRFANDKRPDTEVKEEIYEKLLKNLNIVKVFDDRPSVIRMWRSKGLDVVDVGSGEEF